jgi:hypothetical protein
MDRYRGFDIADIEGTAVRTMVDIRDLASFDAAFGELGLKVGPRTGAARRTQADKEWYVVRRFLNAALRVRVFIAPVTVEKLDPPAPDFGLRVGSAPVSGFIEITEATHPDDQREMTEIEHSDKPVLLGEFGGRFADGASQPGWAWASDILDAVERKKGKAVYIPSRVERHLVIYPNSNASSLLFDKKDERSAFAILFNSVADKRKKYVELVNGCSVHVLGKDHVCFNVFDEPKLVGRSQRKSL